MSSRRALLESLLLSRLPSAFQEVEYLESSGTQYIDTNSALNNPKIECQIQITSNTGAANQTVFGRQDFGFNKFLFTTNAKKFIFFSNGGNLYPDEYSVNEIFTAIISKTSQNVNNVSNTRIDTSSSADGNILIAKCGNYYGSYRYMYIKIYDEDNNNALVRDFVPCYRKADNVAGLYDLVNGVFYTNAGACNFIVGGNV